MNRFTPNLETLDERINLSAKPLPVLMVLADQRDYYKEPAQVKTVEPQQDSAIVFVGGWGSSMYQYATPHVGGMLVGLGDGSVRGVQPAADGADYSAIAFVGGWGSSM